MVVKDTVKNEEGVYEVEVEVIDEDLIGPIKELLWQQKTKAGVLTKAEMILLPPEQVEEDGEDYVEFMLEGLTLYLFQDGTWNYTIHGEEDGDESDSAA